MTMTMTKKERVLAALNHKEPDKVPIDLWGSASRICNELYFEIVKDQKWADLGTFVQASRSGDWVDERVSDLVDADIRHTQTGKPKYFVPHTDDDGVTYTEWGVGFKKQGDESVIAVNPLA